MTTVLPITVLAGLILILCGRLLLQAQQNKRSRSITVEDFEKARTTLDRVILEKAVMERIFAAEDAAFISREGAPELVAFFEKERKALAIKWLKKTRAELSELIDMHLKLASYTRNPSPRFEIGLSVRYLAFVVGSHIALLLILIRGPFKASRAFSYAFDVTKYFYTIFAFRFEEVNPLQLRSLAE